METEICKHCTHFHQHYTLCQSRAAPVNCGHCFYPGHKKRRPDTPACKYFSLNLQSPVLPDRLAVVNYLTVEMLEYIRSLELPPEVIDD